MGRFWLGSLALLAQAAQADVGEATRSGTTECWSMMGSGAGMVPIWYHGGLYMLVHGVVTLLFFVLLISLVARLLRGPRRWRHPGGLGWHEGDMPDSTDRTRSAQRILNERFARGEIDRAEFEERRSALLKEA